MSGEDLSFNHAAAERLRQYARLLEFQRANPFRVNAYQRAAQTLESLQLDARDILREGGAEALSGLPFIGSGMALAIDEIAKTGRLARLDRLRGSADPETLLRSVPGIGPQLARKLHEALDITSLEALEIAAHDGRLAGLPGVGERRAEAIRATVAKMLGRVAAPRAAPLGIPDVGTLLDIDREYRERAAAGDLPRIAPRRFNPRRDAWLPVLHATRGDLHFTALHSNTARAHELGRTRDWVVIYFYDDEHHESRHTVVTETHGPLEGRRVVRGREAECADHYGEPAYRLEARSA
ncbi:MAG TPA: helix-hairpin-helix domain-containing protein [Gammaproteobacteria bacterium]|nr:helix-hairpin-helix domain-containing protein [Gammaproteobacteria bacterium]